MSTVKDFRCNGCGAPLPIPKNSKGHVKCPSCKTECVIEGLIKNAEIAAKENIESGIPLTASPATLHRELVSCLTEAPSIPLDVFEKGEVVREERYCVPAYCFHCNGTESFTYDVANERSQVVVRGDGERSWEETRRKIEWDNGKSSTAAVRQTIFVSGNKKLASQIKELYLKFDPKKLVDIEELEFPFDVETLNSDLPQTAAFNEYAVPYIEKMLKKKAEDSLAKQKTRDLQMGGANIQKDTTRVFLGLYRVVFMYGGKEYSVWVTGDGQKTFHEGMPMDMQLYMQHQKAQKALEEKKQSMEQEVTSIPVSKGVGLFFGMCASMTGGIILASALHPICLILGLAGSIVPLVLLFKKEKLYKAQVEAQVAEVRVKYQKEIDDIEAQLPDVNVVQRFKEQKKALRGIYEEVTGDASAF